MKHLLFMVAATILGGLGAVYHPFWGLLLYYALAVLRPQYLWQWALPIQFRWSLFAAVIVMLSLFINAGRGFFRMRFGLIPILMIAYSFMLMASIMNAYYPQTAQEWGIEYAKIIGIALVACLVIDRLWQVRMMFLMILIAMAYIAWEVNYLYLLEGRLDIFHKGYGGLDNNGAGLMLAMSLPLAYAFAVTDPRRWVRAACWIAAIVIVHATLMSFSRGAMMSGLIGIIWILLHHKPRKQAVAIALVGCFAVSILAGQEIRDRFRSTADYSLDTSAQSRFDSWRAGWEIAVDHPLTGQGIRNSKFFTNNYGADKIGRTIHSQYIQIAADTGIIAMALYIAIVIAALWHMRHTRKLCLDYHEDWEAEQEKLTRKRHHAERLGLPDGKHHEHRPPAEPDAMVMQFRTLALAGEASLLIFATGASFLSVEVVELPWLLIVLAGVLPEIMREHITAAIGRAKAEAGEPQPTPSSIKVVPSLLPAAPRLGQLANPLKGLIQP